MTDPWHIRSGRDQMPSARNRRNIAKHLRKAHHGVYRAIWHLWRGDIRRALRELDAVGLDENAHSVEFHVARGRERISGERMHDR
jgi:hypothetical protein